MKTRMTVEMWHELEVVMAKLGAGYKVDFDSHNGIPEMVIHVDTIGVMRPEEEVK
jgi:hypothetical protein